MTDQPATQVNPEAMAAFRERLDEGPVTMLNLLKFKPGKAESYYRYTAAVAPLVAKVGGRVVFAGKPAELVIGNEDWDLMVLVEYPKRASLGMMAGSEEYQAIAHLREESLERTVLYAMDAVDFGSSILVP